MNKKTKNSKATKAIALTLAGIAAIGAGSIAASNMKDAKAMRILGGLKAIFTGLNTSNGSAYQGIQKSVSTVNNRVFSKFKAGNSSATVTTSRGLNGSKGSTTSNGSAYQGTPKSDSLVNNSAFDTTVKKHSPATKQMMAVEKQVATSSKSPLTKNQSTQTSTTQSKGTQTLTLRLNVSKDSTTGKTIIEPAVDTSKSDLTKASQKLQKHFSFKTK